MSSAASFETPFASSCYTTQSSWLVADCLLEGGDVCSPLDPEAMLLIVLAALGVPPINPEVEDTILDETTLGL